MVKFYPLYPISMHIK